MEKFISKYLSGDLSKLNGLKIEGAIPFDDEVLNELLDEGLSIFKNDTKEQQSNNSNKAYKDLLKFLNLKVESKAGRVVLSVHFHIT